MNRLTLRPLMLVVLATVSLTSAAINKCTDAEGQVSYQQAPCPQTQKAESVAVDAPPDAAGTKEGEVSSVVLTVAGVGEVGVMAFQHWQVRVNEDAPAPSVKMNTDGLSIQLTYIPRLQPEKVKEQNQKASVRQMAQRYVATSVEQAVQLRRLHTRIGTAILANFNEQKYQHAPVPKGEYSSITIGQIDHQDMSVAVTILTNGPETPQHDTALMVLDSIVVVNL